MTVHSCYIKDEAGLDQFNSGAALLLLKTVEMMEVGKSRTKLLDSSELNKKRLAQSKKHA